MPTNRLIWIGCCRNGFESYKEAIESELGNAVVDVVPEGREALSVMAQSPGEHLIAIIELETAGMELAALVTSVKQINPAVEIIVLGLPGPSWSKLNLPRYYRPIFLNPACGAEALISSVAKLQEMAEAKESYEQLYKGIGEKIGISRTSTEAILRLLDRQDSVGVISLRRDGFFSSYNSEAQRLTGYDLDEVAHIQVWAQALIIDNDSVRTLLAAIELFWAKRTGRENMRLRVAHKNGRIVTLSMTMLVLLDHVGQARQIVMLFFDPLENSAAREYSALTESGACAFYTYLPDTGFIRMSTSAMDLLNKAFSVNLTFNDVISRKITSLPLPSEMAQAWQDSLHRIASGENITHAEFVPMGLDGRRIMDHTFTARIRTGADGGFAVIAVIVPREDLLCQAPQQLPASGLAMKTLNCIPRPFTLVRAVRDDRLRIRDLLCIMMNPAARRLLGLRSNLGSGVPLSTVIVDPQAAATIFAAASEVTETGRDRYMEIRMSLLSSDSGEALVRLWVGKVGDGAALFLKDVTAARDEEKRLTQYRHVFSHMQEAIIVTDLDGNIIDWNPASETMFGYTKDQIYGRPAFILTQNKTGDQLEQPSVSVLRDGDVWTGEYEFIRHDGSRGIAFSVFTLLKDDQGKAYGTVGLCHDLTERKRLEDRLTAKGEELQEKNLALNTLLRYAEQERLRACEQIAADLTKKINERISRILEGKEVPRVVETHAKLLLQELGQRAPTSQIDNDDPSVSLSEKEIEVAKLIRLGKTTEEIAFILDKSPDTVRLQRISIRKKLGLTRRDRNLAGHLKRLDLT